MIRPQADPHAVTANLWVNLPHCSVRKTLDGMSPGRTPMTVVAEEGLEPPTHGLRFRLQHLISLEKLSTCRSRVACGIFLVLRQSEQRALRGRELSAVVPALEEVAVAVGRHLDAGVPEPVLHVLDREPETAILAPVDAP